jgi:hypothetical protein
LLVEIGRAQPAIGEVVGFDYRHEYLPKRTYQAILEHFVDDGEQLGAFAGAVQREALPVAAEPQIGE